MTENETKALKWMKNVRDDAVVTLDHIANNEPNVSPMLYAGRKEKAETIIKCFEELVQYRSIGTVEEIQQKTEELQNWHDEHLEDITVDLPEYRELCDLDEISHMKSLKRIIKRNGTIGKALDECAEYEEIGTVSECREAVEKQKAKIPNIWGDGHADGQSVYDMYDCPGCGISYEIDYHDYKYCPKCGQKIERTDLERLRQT